MSIVKFSEVAHRAYTREDRFNTEKIYYVGGEHIDSCELYVTKKGVIKGSTIGPMFYCGFTAGQILFVTRNPHLKKCSIADFDGICSEKTFVIETKDESILTQEYLAIIMQSDDFWNYCEENKSGGVNYFLNWSTLADYEFELPPIKQQLEIAQKVMSAYRLKQSYKKLLNATREMVKSQFIEMFGNPVTNTKGWKTAKIKDVAPEMPSKEQLSGKIWLLNLDMIESNTGRIIEKVYEDVENALSVQSFDEGNVLFSKLRPYLNKVVIPDEPGMATTELVPLRPEPSKLHKVFLSHLLRGNQFVNYANDIAGGTKMPRMPLTELRNFDCILPPMDKQLEFVFIAEQVDKSKFGDFKSQFIEIFYGMETTPVKDYIDDSFPGEWGTEDKDGNGVKVIRTTNFTNSGKLNLADVVTRSIEDRKVVRKQIKKYDTILERSGGTADNPVGRVVLFEEDNLFLCNNFTQVLRFKDVDPRFAFYALYYFYQTNRTAIRSMGSKTTGIQNLNMSKYLEIGIPNASDEDQKAFVTIAEQADKSKSVIQKALVYLNDIQSDELGKIA